MYLAPCLQGREPNDQALDLFFQRFRKRVERLDPQERADVTLRLDTEQAEPVAAGARPAVDAELLGIFLEEAGEVLGRMESASARLAASSASDLEALGIIRRGFHTFKGSGRMVGLMDLGEVAWEVEQLLNLWLEEKRPAGDALLDFLKDAPRARSANGCASCGDGSLRREIDGVALVHAARALKAAPPPPPPPEDITIGGTTLSRPFFEIYIKEARRARERARDRVRRVAQREPGADISQAFLRAAHTLASSSGTAGFAEAAAVGAAIEQWIPFARESDDPGDAEVHRKTRSAACAR